MEDDIITPELSISADINNFNPVVGMVVSTSAPVKKNEFIDSLSLKSESGNNIEAQIQAMKNEDKTESETSFVITPKSGPFFYATNYGLSVKKGLKPKYGTEPLATDFAVTARSADFVSNSQVYRKIYNASGALVDTREYDSNSFFLSPTQNILLRQVFMTEVGLDKNLFVLRTLSGKTLDFTLAYVKQPKYDDLGNVVGDEENKNMIDVIPTTVLENNTIYQFVVNKKANSSLPSDVIKTYKTAPKFEVL